MNKFAKHHDLYSGKYKNEWFTPPEVIRALGGPFDLDPCSMPDRPFEIAKKYYFVNGLELPWDGRVWLNPPYSNIEPWIAKLAGYGNGIALVFARTDTKWFRQWIWDRAGAVYFFGRRLSFYGVNGEVAKNNAGAPSVLAAYGRENIRALWDCKLPGRFVLLNNH